MVQSVFFSFTTFCFIVLVLVNMKMYDKDLNYLMFVSRESFYY